jgi:hypothetical protein
VLVMFFWWGSCWSCFLVGFVLVIFFSGVRVGHVFWWGPCWSFFLVGFVLVMFFGGVRDGHVFWWGS